jgi:DNA-directed RNA polymerase specialized sigma24 family protein
MVPGVARRVVRDHHAAEDVFQATFLALARDAGRLRRPDALPAWLHHTANTSG